MKSKVLSIASDYLIMTLGVALYCVAWEFFMIPNGMSSGGLTGLCTILQYATNGAIDVSTSYLVSNIFLLLLGFIFIGNAFGVKTIYCILMSTLLLRLFGTMDMMFCLPGQFMYIPEKILIPVLAGVLEGTGLAMIFLVGGSTGGTDIIALFFNKYWPISTAKAFLIMDIVIITGILFLPDRTLSDTIYGYLMMIASVSSMDFVMVGRRSSLQLLVFSSKYQEIADYIINKMDRGVTVLRAQGWYTKLEKNVLLIIVGRTQIHDLKKVIKSIDKDAFVSVTATSSVYGEGFEEIKVGYKKDSKKQLKSGDEKRD